MVYTKDIDLKFHKSLGYYYFFDKGHPLCYADNKVWYHRHVASLKSGRWLSGNEHVHHKDRNSGNNDPENLESVTPQEHARIHALENGFSILSEYICEVCGIVYCAWKHTQTTCSDECRDFASRKVLRPSKEALEILIWSTPTTKIAQSLGVSDKAIEKWCKLYKIDKPPIGYWAPKDTLSETY